MELSHNQRLDELIKGEALNKSKFSKRISYDPRNLSNYLTGNTAYPNGALVINVLKHYPRWNIRYWLLGHGTPKMEEDKIVVIQESTQDLKNKSMEELTEYLASLEEELKEKDRIIKAYETIAEATSKLVQKRNR